MPNQSKEAVRIFLLMLVLGLGLIIIPYVTEPIGYDLANAKTVLDFIFLVAMPWILGGFVGIMLLIGLGINIYIKYMEKVCKDDEYNKWKRDLETVDWTFNKANARIIQKEIKQLLKERGIILEDDHYYHFEFKENTLRIYPEYEGFKVKVLAFQVPENLKSRVEVYKKW